MTPAPAGIRAAFARMLSARAVSLVVMVTAFATLGRLLDPVTFGHFALALAVYSLASTSAAFGLASFLIREREVSAETARRAVGLGLTLAALGAVVLLAVAWALGGRLLPVPAAQALALLALALLAEPFSAVGQALLQRVLDFRLISAVEVLRAAVDAGTAIALASAGYGATALAGGILASRLATAAVVVAAAGDRARLVPRFGGWHGFRGFGTRLVAIDLLSVIAGLALTSMVAGLLGAATLGLYDRARNIRMMLDKTVFEGIQPVVLPAISRSIEAGWSPADLHRAKIDYLAAICWPAFALIALLADPIVAVLLGPGWEEAVPAVRILALAGLAIPVTKLSQKIFVAVGLLDDYLRFLAVQHCLRLALGALGALFSLEAVCAALAVAALIKAAALMRMLTRRFGAGRPLYAALAARNLAVTAAALAGPVALLAWGPPAGALPTLAAVAPLGALGWLGALVATRHRLLREMRGALRRPGRADAP